MSARQLRNRADMALHAALRLDLVLRKRVENMLLTQLRDPNADFGHRADCVFIGLVLEEYSHDFAVVAISRVLGAMAETTDPYALWPLAEAVAALAPRLGPAEAAAAAQKALGAMAETTNRYALGSLAEAVAALAPRLGPAEAAAAAAAAAQKALGAMAETTDSFALRSLAEAVAALAPRLGPAEAAAAAQKALGAMAKTTDPDVLRYLAEAVAAFVTKLELADIPQRVNYLAAGIGIPTTPPHLLANFAFLAEASRPLPGRFSEQQLVDFLKLPTCPSQARRLILKQLGQQCGRDFDTVWDFVRWARAHRPDLDLTRPVPRTQ
jgi:hypothetical protein